jgi:hypothetical protein
MLDVKRFLFSTNYPLNRNFLKKNIADFCLLFWIIGEKMKNIKRTGERETTRNAKV